MRSEIICSMELTLTTSCKQMCTIYTYTFANSSETQTQTAEFLHYAYNLKFYSIIPDLFSYLALSLERKTAVTQTTWQPTMDSALVFIVPATRFIKVLNEGFINEFREKLCSVFLQLYLYVRKTYANCCQPEESNFINVFIITFLLNKRHIADLIHFEYAIKKSEARINVFQMRYQSLLFSPKF